MSCRRHSKGAGWPGLRPGLKMSIRYLVMLPLRYAHLQAYGDDMGSASAGSSPKAVPVKRRREPPCAATRARPKGTPRGMDLEIGVMKIGRRGDGFRTGRRAIYAAFLIIGVKSDHCSIRNARI